MSARERDDQQERLERLLREIEASRAGIDASRDAILASEERLRNATDLLAELVDQRVLAPEEPAPTRVPALPSAGLEPEPPAASSPPPRAHGERNEDDYLYIISHDLKEPLRGITYFGQLLSEDYADRLDADGREHLDYILAATKRMNRLLEDILTLSRLQRRPLTLVEVDLETTVRGVIEELKPLIREQRATVEIKSPLPTVTADQGRMRELFWILFKNALTYSEAPVRIEVEAEGPIDGFHLLKVRDDGIGIEPQFLEQIFGLFQRLHSWETYEGTGAGLAIARKIVALHGGRIWANSSVGRGSTFSVTLPVQRSEAAGS